MKKLSKMTGKLIVAAQILAITLILLAACAPGFSSTVCHATGDPASPYEVITINSAQLLDEHRVHPDDIIPVPAGGCPASLEATSPGEASDGKVTICHATNSETNPYTEITVSANGLDGHDKHAGDIIPASEGGCPTTKP
jgi:hypothetical protein